MTKPAPLNPKSKPDPAGHDLVRQSDGYWLKQHRITVDRRKQQATKRGEA